LRNKNQVPILAKKRRMSTENDSFQGTKAIAKKESLELLVARIKNSVMMVIAEAECSFC